jgi:hypothetical protein
MAGLIGSVNGNGSHSQWGGVLEREGVGAGLLEGAGLVLWGLLEGADLGIWAALEPGRLDE